MWHCPCSIPDRVNCPFTETSRPHVMFIQSPFRRASRVPSAGVQSWCVKLNTNLRVLLDNYMRQRLFWQAGGSLNSQSIPRILPKINPRHKPTQQPTTWLSPVPDQYGQIPSYFLKIHFNIILSSILDTSMWLFAPQGFHPKRCMPSLLPMRAACLTKLIPLVSITIKIFV
jgi:hypothetical protein